MCLFEVDSQQKVVPSLFYKVVTRIYHTDVIILIFSFAESEYVIRYVMGHKGFFLFLLNLLKLVVDHVASPIRNTVLFRQ